MAKDHAVLVPPSLLNTSETSKIADFFESFKVGSKVSIDVREELTSDSWKKATVARHENGWHFAFEDGTSQSLSLDDHEAPTSTDMWDKNSTFYRFAGNNIVSKRYQTPLNVPSSSPASTSHSSGENDGTLEPVTKDLGASFDGVAGNDCVENSRYVLKGKKTDHLETRDSGGNHFPVSLFQTCSKKDRRKGSPSSWAAASLTSLSTVMVDPQKGK